MAIRDLLTSSLFYNRATSSWRDLWFNTEDKLSSSYSSRQLVPQLVPITQGVDAWGDLHNLHRLCLREPQHNYSWSLKGLTPNCLEIAALKSNRLSVLDLGSTDAKPLSNSFGSGFFCWWILNSILIEESLTQTSRNRKEQPTIHIGGVAIYSRDLPEGEKTIPDMTPGQCTSDALPTVGFQTTRQLFLKNK